MSKAGQSGSALMASSWGDDLSSAAASQKQAQQKRVVRGGGQVPSSNASSVGSANTVAETLGDVAGLKSLLQKAINDHGDFTGASVESVVQKLGVLFFTTLLSRCLTLLKALWRVEDARPFALSTASGRMARSSNQAVIGRYLGGQAWNAVCQGGLTGSGAYGRVVVLLMGAMHGRLAFARKMCSKPAEWQKDTDVSGWITQFGAEYKDGIFPLADVFFGKKSEDTTIRMSVETVKSKVDSAFEFAMHECNDFFDNSTGRKPPVYVVAKKLVECLRGNLLDEMCGKGDAAVQDIVASLSTKEGRKATGQMLGQEVVSGMQTALGQQENAKLGEAAVRALAGAAVNAFRFDQMDIFSNFLTDSLNAADPRVKALFGQPSEEKEDRSVPKIVHVSG